MGDLPGGMFSHDIQCLIPDGRPTLHRSKPISLRSTPYQHASLRTPVNDATDMAATLQQLGFEITLLLDADLQTMQTALQLFNQRLRQGGVGLFYFAGQGVQIRGDMYLIPLGVRL